MFDMSFKNVSFLRMKYEFEETWMIFDIVCEGEWEEHPLILYEINTEEAKDLVEKGVGVWVLDGIPCVDEQQAVAGARSQAKYIRKAFLYVKKAYETLRNRGEIDGLRRNLGHIRPYPKNWGKVASMESAKRNGQGS